MGEIDKVGEKWVCEPEPDSEVVLNVCDEEPVAEGIKRITVVEPGNLK